MTEISRRTVLANAAATAAAVTFSTVTPLLLAEPQTASEIDDNQLTLFIRLSAALTGIDASKLAPGVDPIDVKSQYFTRARDAGRATFERMLEIFGNNQSDAATVGNIILSLSGPDVRYLARSIMLAWYLGAWYDPAVLEQYNSANPPPPPVPYTIISPAAYTQGWVWRVAQAHPMGYSNLQFGYWSKEPPSRNAFIKPT